MSECLHHFPCATDSDSGIPAGEVIEIPLLLPDWQVSALETAAHHHGMTAGEMVRLLVREFLARRPGPRLGDRVIPSAH